MSTTPGRRILGDHPRRRGGDHFWSPSSFAASCGDAPLTIIKEYIDNQRHPD
ncbi:transposase [Streptomyces sp. NPDC057681]|uniref:transposase n=1 Tax=unclassified Streptomyces TaxID=2593676 RepID=UPI0036D1F86D